MNVEPNAVRNAKIFSDAVRKGLVCLRTLPGGFVGHVERDVVRGNCDVSDVVNRVGNDTVEASAEKDRVVVAKKLAHALAIHLEKRG